jgi:hypothetical protein
MIVLSKNAFIPRTCWTCWMAIQSWLKMIYHRRLNIWTLLFAIMSNIGVLDLNILDLTKIQAYDSAIVWSAFTFCRKLTPLCFFFRAKSDPKVKWKLFDAIVMLNATTCRSNKLSGGANIFGVAGLLYFISYHADGQTSYNQIWNRHWPKNAILSTVIFLASTVIRVRIRSVLTHCDSKTVSRKKTIY